MKIIADENIPCVVEAFASLGEVTLVPGRHVRAAQLRDADILLVRSVTRVDETLLADSSVRFVGSATIGFDHVDREYLARQGIGFAAAPGSNAVSAAEYVVSSIMVLSERQGFEPADKTVGIIGYGNVGTRVCQRLEALGMQCLVNDPPLEARGSEGDFVDLDTVLQADIITLHVPYTRSGQWPTHHLINAEVLAGVGPDTIFINTSRGAVIDNPALEAWLARHSDAAAVLDVWEGEPSISIGLMDRVAIATPHIAGYSIEGKLRGTDMIYHAACDYLGETAVWSARKVLPAGPEVMIHVEDPDECSGTVRRAVLDCYDVRGDDGRLRRMKSLAPEERPIYFDRLRREYPVRHEFSAIRLLLDAPVPEAQSVLEALGLRCLPAGGQSATADRAGAVAN